VEGGKQDLDVLVNRDNQIDRLEMSILMYLGKLSQLEHTESQARDMISLTQIASTLEALSDVVTTNLTSLGQRRLAERIDLATLKDDRTSEFADAVIQNLADAIETFAQGDSTQAAKVLAAKNRIRDLAESARNSILAKLRLSEMQDVVRFSLATDMVEQFKQIARFARQIARIVKEWTRHRATDSSLSSTSEAAGAEPETIGKDSLKLGEKSD
jgi:phosphate:Na+ symporter